MELISLSANLASTVSIFCIESVAIKPRLSLLVVSVAVVGGVAPSPILVFPGVADVPNLFCAKAGDTQKMDSRRDIVNTHAVNEKIELYF